MNITQKITITHCQRSEKTPSSEKIIFYNSILDSFTVKCILDQRFWLNFESNGALRSFETWQIEGAAIIIVPLGYFDFPVSSRLHTHGSTWQEINFAATRIRKRENASLWKYYLNWLLESGNRWKSRLFVYIFA